MAGPATYFSVWFTNVFFPFYTKISAQKSLLKVQQAF